MCLARQSVANRPRRRRRRPRLGIEAAHRAKGVSLVPHENNRGRGGRGRLGHDAQQLISILRGLRDLRAMLSPSHRSRPEEAKRGRFAYTI
jgi:hypothetical protein